MAAIIAAVAATSAALSTLHLTRRSSFSRHRRAFRSLSPPLRSSLSSSSPPSASEEFNITFAPKPKTQKPGEKPSSSIDDELPSGQLLIPWIVRGPDGNLTLQSHPPAHLLHAMADAKTQKKKAGIAKLVEEPKYSKAARRFYNDRFREPPQRLSKVLAAAGVASRRNCEDLIFEGQVTVNGSVCKTPQTKVDPARDVIYVKGNRLPKKLPPKVYLALNKPKGYICSSGGDEFNSLMVLFDDYLKSWDKRNSGQPRPRLFTVGRLDVATTGLIIVTNDGEFAQKISHPSSNLTKEYIATIDSEVHKRHLIAISEGTTIDGVHCTPDLVELLPRQPDLPRPRVRIVVHEGRNHEVRELVKDAGLEIYSLKRTRIGGYRLPSDLGLGKHVELKQSDLKALGWTS
ncbi:Putative ribosomal large subunit pseudouridine synthase svr1, chloroplastic [Ancistrocladus abbreviatus]